MEKRKTRQVILFTLSLIFLSLLIGSKSPMGICCCGIAFIYCLISIIILK